MPFVHAFYAVIFGQMMVSFNNWPIFATNSEENKQTKNSQSTLFQAHKGLYTFRPINVTKRPMKWEKMFNKIQKCSIKMVNLFES